jgi:peptidoglycan-associated lipoprotein
MDKCKLLLISLVATAAAGCASNSVPDPEPAADSEIAESSAGTDGYVADEYAGGEPVIDDAPPELDAVIYFDYDQAELRPEYVELLARHAERMSGSARVEVRLEGHADERGSREYNVGLGERRSQSVRRILIAHGIPTEQLTTVSYGEERPAALGSDEQSHSLNRRVEIRYDDMTMSGLRSNR